MTTMIIDQWTVIATIDDDGHLTVSIDHADDTEVIQIDADIGLDDIMWADRFTTKAIEATYHSQ